MLSLRALLLIAGLAFGLTSAAETAPPACAPAYRALGPLASAPKAHPLDGVAASLHATDPATGKSFGAWAVEPVTAANSAWAYTIIDRAYRGIGSPVSSPADLDRYTHLLVFREHPGAKPTAVAASWDSPRGAKIGLLADDGSPAGRAGSNSLRLTYSRYPGVYVETSKASGHIAAKDPALVVVPFATARELLDGAIRRPTPAELREALAQREIPNRPEVIENAYVRTLRIDGQAVNVIKVMLGRPR